MLLSRRRRRKPTQRSCCCCPACAAKTAAADHVAVLLLLLWLYLSSPSGGGGGVGCLAFCPHRHRGRSRLRLPQQHCPQNDCRHRREGENLPPPPLVLQLPLPLALNQPRLLQQQQQQRGRGASLLRLLFASWRWRWRWHDHCHRFRDVVRFAPLQQQMRSVLVRARLRLLSLALAAIVASMAVFPAAAMAAAAAAVTAGRAGGGSFGPSSSRSSPSASHHHHRSHHGGGTCTRVFRTGQLPPQIRLYSSPSPPNIIVIQRQRCQQPHLLSRRSTLRNRDDLAAFRWSPGDVLIWVGVGSVITYGFVNNKHKNQGSMIRDDDGGSASALGPGATACHLLLVFLLHRKGPSSGHLLRRIRDRSDRADTTVRKGVQDLVTDVALELLRQVDPCLVSAHARSHHYSSVAEAERAFQRWSVQDRSKFDGEAVDRFGTKPFAADEAKESDDSKKDDDDDRQRRPDGQLALVSLNLSIRGDSTVLPAIRDRKDVLQALEVIAADSQVDDCLRSAEILWAPEPPDNNDDDGDDAQYDSNELTMEGLAADYPELVPL